MGNSQSSSHQSQTRSEKITDLANYIKSNKCKNVVVMLGPGVSTSAGIPNYMAPSVGAYLKMAAKMRLLRPEIALEINYFCDDPVPFYTLAAELYPSSLRPTPTHSFIKLLATHNLLHLCFTQNIDTLERRADIPVDKLVEAHGSFATHHCILCGAPFDDSEMRAILQARRLPGQQVRIPKCKNGTCGGLVKPDVVLFGEPLPNRFISTIPQVRKADLLLVIGTSLTIQPFASLPDDVNRKCRRVLINHELAGDIGRRPGDTVFLGKSDDIIRELCAALGWADELEKAWAETARNAHWPAKGENEGAKVKGREESLEEQMDNITNGIGKQLDLGESVEQASAASSRTRVASPEASVDI